MKYLAPVFLALFSVSLFAHPVDSLRLDSHHLYLDASLKGAAVRPFMFSDFREAAAQLGDSCTLYIAPGVYWVDDPDNPEVAVGENGREPFGIVIRAKNLHFIGLDKDARNVVLASQRGQTQGAVGNFTMFDFWCDSLVVENLTMGNYCNVDLDFPLDPSLSRPKRNEAITQAHVGYVHGKSLTAKNVRFISRLNLNPLNGAESSYYEDCHFECTDDAMNGTAVYRHCTVDLYGQKPFWSTFGRGAMFIDCDFYVKSDNREMYFCKQGGPLTLIDCRYHAPTDSVYIGWTAYPQRWLRCYQQNFTLNGKPYLIGNRQPENTIVLHDVVPSVIPYQPISRHEAALLTGRDSLLLASPNCEWRVQPGFEQYITLRPVSADTILVVPANHTDETVDFCIEAYTDEACVAACELSVAPSLLPSPSFRHKPRICFRDGYAMLDYKLDTDGWLPDESDITWYIAAGCILMPVGVSHDKPSRTYLLHESDLGAHLLAIIRPKHSRSLYDTNLVVEARRVVKASDIRVRNELSTDFSDFPCETIPIVSPGCWTVDGYKPADTAEFPWDFNRSEPMWKYGEGFNGAVGKGLLQEQRGARLMYTPIERSYGDMSVTLLVDPTKTAGQGFGSATGQYMDVCLKFDTRTLTGYGLRIIRTTKHAKAVDFLLVKYENGIVTPITDAVSSTCYRTGCTIRLEAHGNLLTAHVETTTPQPKDSQLPHVVDLQAPITPSPFGGFALQHTGSSGGESTTMLHHLTINW